MERSSGAKHSGSPRTRLSRAWPVTLAITTTLACGSAAWSATPAAAGTVAQRLVPGTHPPGRFNVGATHSPYLHRMLAGGQADPQATSVTTGQAQGIDVSSGQHPSGAAIDWSQVAAAGYKFAFIKATEGSYYVNPFYAVDVAGASAAGLFTAAYHFAVPNDSSGTLQADLALDTTGDTTGSLTLPLILDIEYDPYNSLDHAGWCYGLTTTAMVAWLSAFTTEVQRRTGLLPVIYTTAQWWNKCTGRSTAFGADPLWVAGSKAGNPVLPVGWKHWAYYQYTSTATVPGVAVATDASWFSDTALAPATPAVQAGQAGAAVTLPVQTLNAAAGESLTWSAAGLPAGLSIDPASGVISGNLPATPASYPVTATLTDAAAQQATVSFDWQVHGTVRLTSPGKQVTPAGRAVDLQLQAPDGLPGCSLTFTASGLPPGLAISSCGRITGWPSRPGQYQVSVRAGDSATPALAGTTISWTVTPAPVVATGVIHLGTGGRCLAVSKAAASPPAPQLQSCGKPGAKSGTAQSWELGQNGTLRLGTRCLAAITSSGTTVPGLRACTSRVGQLWRRSGSGGLVSAATGQCLTSGAGDAALTLAACADTASQQWSLPAGPLRPDLGGQCLAATKPAGPGQASIKLTSCARSAAQAWRITPAGAITAAGGCLTTAQPAIPGSAVTLTACPGSTPQAWHPIPGTGATLNVSPAAGLCLDAAASATPGGPLTLGYCVTGSPRLAWSFS